MLDNTWDNDPEVRHPCQERGYALVVTCRGAYLHRDSGCRSAENLPQAPVASHQTLRQLVRNLPCLADGNVGEEFGALEMACIGVVAVHQLLTP
jgi:hypothetical protein